MKLLFKINAKVSYFFVNDTYFIVIDETNKIFYFDSALKFINGIKLKLPSNKPDENSVKISKNAKILLIAVKNFLYLFDFEHKKLIKSFQNNCDILSVGISEDEKYFALGDINGDVKIYSLKLKKYLFSLPKHKDFITDILFDKEKNFLIAATFDKAVVFYNLITFNKKEKYLHTEAVKKISENNFLVSMDKNSYGINWDKTFFEYQDIIKIYENFKDFYIDGEYLLIATDKKILIYNLEKAEMENDDFLNLVGIEKITVFKNYLIVSTEKGELFYRNLFEEEVEFLDFVLKEDFQKAYELIEKNPFLKRSRGYEKLNKIINLIIKKAMKLFETDEAAALNILDKLLIVPQLRNRVEKFINDYKHLKKFLFALKEKNFSLAYNLAEHYPLLKKTKYYKFLEKAWEVAYKKAKEAALNGEIEKARSLLEPFLGVGEKISLIKTVLEKSEIFKLINEKIANRDFKGFFDLAKEHPEIKNTEEYISVLNYAKKLYNLALKYINEENFEKAKETALILKDFEDYEDKAKEFLKKIENSIQFLAYLRENPKKAFEMTDLYPYLKNLKEYREFLSKYNKTVEKAEELIHRGNIKEAKNILETQKIHTTSRVENLLKNNDLE